MQKFVVHFRRRFIPDEELIQDLKRVAKKLKKNCVSRVEYDEHGRFSSDTPFDRFGSWHKALEAAGLQICCNWRIPDEELLKNIQDCWLKLGRQPNCHEMKRPFSRYGANTYIARFGSWRQTLERFVQFLRKGKLKKSVKVITHRTSRIASARMRLAVMQRDNFRCRLCGRSPSQNPGISLQVDHIRPWSEGGETVLDNLQTLCSACNAGKSNRKI
jgi:hypothetical protein